MNPLDRIILSLPPGMATAFKEIETRGSRYFGCSDPGVSLGSGGGTAHALVEGWKASGWTEFNEWLDSGTALVIHSGGQSRRLPSYAPVGKALIPVPIERGSVGQRFDQCLLDLQVESLQPVLDSAPDETRVVVFCGDVLIKLLGPMKKIAASDVACLGFECSPEVLTGFGAFFSSWESPEMLDFVRQKPTVAETRSLSANKKCLADGGLWLLSKKAVLTLMRRCGWREEDQTFENEVARTYDLYGEFGLGLGRHPTDSNAQLQLSTSIFEPLSVFFHFGTSRQVVESMTKLHTMAASAANSRLGFTTAELRQPDQHVQNVEFLGGQRLKPGLPLWIENCSVSPKMMFEGDNFLTGLPRGEWNLTFSKGVCLDIVPIDEDRFCCRFYGYDDNFSGEIGDEKTRLVGHPASQWFERRGIDLSTLVKPGRDIQEATIFPVVPSLSLTSEFLEWLIRDQSPTSDSSCQLYLVSERLSARDLLSRTNYRRLYDQRNRFGLLGLQKVVENRDRSAFYTMDLHRAAELASKTPDHFRLLGPIPELGAARTIREQMFASELDRLSGGDHAEAFERNAFQSLREAIVRKERLEVPPPTSSVLPEQIVWGRSPIRLDLAGGWTDTPPYSLLHGGRVVNVAVELNGQPPIQVFGRVTDQPRIVLKSIDLGSQVSIEEFSDLETHELIGSEFALAKTALILAGFGNRYGTRSFDSLKHQLSHFGGGLELNMLAAVPKGSGLGTSSVLSAALLSTVGSICSQNWTEQDVFERVLVSEQLLTSGGGWQDQAGGVLPGLKLLSTEPGPNQTIQCHWLPDHVLGDGIANVTALLFYTGITRTAKGVLKEIVRGMFLNHHDRLSILKQIGQNTAPAVEAIMRNSFSDLGRTIRKSWELNQALDSGTCPPNVKRIYDLIDDYVLGAKLLGAGGGGYLLMLCKDVEAASRVRSLLSENVSEPGSRFVDFGISRAGLTITRS